MIQQLLLLYLQFSVHAKFLKQRSRRQYIRRSLLLLRLRERITDLLLNRRLYCLDDLAGISFQ